MQKFAGSHWASLTCSPDFRQPYQEAERIGKAHPATFDTLDFDVYTNQKWDRLQESHAQDIVVHYPDGHQSKGLAAHIEEGLVTSTVTLDVTALYPHVHYDGHAFVRTHDGQELSHPKDEEPGILFEIGRLMVEHDVQCGVEYIDPNAKPDPSASIDNGYYQVHINGQDAGVALTPSGASLALRQAGLKDGSAAWRNVITSADSFTRRTRAGKEERVQLTYRVRRSVVDDLSFVYGTMPWIPPDTD